MIYGSSRIGLNDKFSQLISWTPPPAGQASRTLGLKGYELTDHLGNVLTTISDRKKRLAGATPAFEAVIETAQDYYPFGSLMPGRKNNAGEYRYGFNGQEKDDEIAGVTGSHTTALFWEYDTRLGRRWNLDPKPTFGLSEYSCFGNNPILYSDLLGDKFSKEDNKKVNDHIKLTKNQIKKYDRMLANTGNMSTEAIEEIQSMKNNLKASLNEIDVLKRSTTLYSLSKHTSTDFSTSGLTSMIGNDNILLEYSNNTALAHELKHAYQYEIGKMTFFKQEDGSFNKSHTYDITDEVEAWKRGYSFSNINTNEFNNYSEITSSNIRNLISDRGKTPYANLPNESITAFSTYSEVFMITGIKSYNIKNASEIRFGDLKNAANSFMVNVRLNSTK